MNKNFNKNYRLPFERAYRKTKLRNHSFRKLSSVGHVVLSPNWRVSRSKNYWDIPHRLMISIDTPEPLVPILHDLKQVLFRTAY